MSYFVYFVRTKNNKLYIGHSDNLIRRKTEHNTKRDAKFVKDNFAVSRIVYYEKYPTRAEAMKREKQLKRWTRAKKEALISQNTKRLKEL